MRRGRWGAEIVRIVADLVHGEGAEELLTSYVSAAGGPWPFYRRLGFVETDKLDDDDEAIISLDLRARP